MQLSLLLGKRGFVRQVKMRTFLEKKRGEF